MELLERDVSTPVPYKSRRWAIPFHKAWQRWMCLVLHRRAGKTTACLLQHQRAATNDEWETWRLRKLKPGLTDGQLKDLLRSRVYGHVLPTRVQAKLAAWDHLKYYARTIKGAEPNESELRIDYPGGHRVQLFGGDEPDKLRGPAFSGLSLDEFGMQRPNLFSEVLSKNLADHLGYCIFAGTIKGKNQLFRTWKAAQGADEWFTIWQDIKQSLATEDDASILMLQQAMLDDQMLIHKGLMTQEEYDQEWFLSTEAAIKGAYYAKQIAAARREGRIRSVPYDPALPVFDVWDLGTGGNLSVGCFQRIMRELLFIDYLEGADGDGIPQMVKTLQLKPYVYGKHFAPFDIKTKDLSTGKTRLETAKNLGWPFEIVPDISVDDGINAGKLAFARLYIDEEHCAPWLEMIGHYRRPWDDKLGVFGPNPVHDFASHPADMWRYAAIIEEKMTNERRHKKPQGRKVVSGPNAGLGWMT